MLSRASAGNFDFDYVAFIVQSDRKECRTSLQYGLLWVQLAEVLLRPWVTVYCWLWFAFRTHLLAIEL